MLSLCTDLDVVRLATPSRKALAKSPTKFATERASVMGMRPRALRLLARTSLRVATFWMHFSKKMPVRQTHLHIRQLAIAAPLALQSLHIEESRSPRYVRIVWQEHAYCYCRKFVRCCFLAVVSSPSSNALIFSSYASVNATFCRRRSLALVRQMTVSLHIAT